MEFQAKHYKYYKIKNHLKVSNFLLIYNGACIKSFIKINQKLKKLDLHYYKVCNALMKKALKKSIYKNFRFLINGLVMVIKPKNINTNITFTKFLDLDGSLYLITIKINNKFYHTCKIKHLLNLNFKNNHAILITSLKTYLKLPFKLTE